MIAFSLMPSLPCTRTTSSPHHPRACANDGNSTKSRRRLSRRASLVALAAAACGAAQFLPDIPPSALAEPTGTERAGRPLSTSLLRDISKRIFAATMDNGMEEYEARIASRKRQLFARIAPNSDVLDVGLGTGPNLRYIPANCSVVGVEPNVFMWESAKAKARAYDVQLTLRDAVAEKLPLPDCSADVVVSTLTLCSVRKPEAALDEIIRVLRPGGMFLFIEHVLAGSDERVRRTAQKLLSPLQRALADGCNLDRDTEALIRARAPEYFDLIRVDRFKAEFGDPFENISLVTPHISGYARRSSA